MKRRKTIRRSVLRGFFLAVLLSGLFLCAGAEVNPEPYERVIIIGVDGAGTLFPEGETPNFHRIFDGGVITDDARAVEPTSSAPGWGSMFTGVLPAAHGLTNAEAGQVHKTNELYPSIFKLTREAFPKKKAASFANWNTINWGLIEWGCGVYMFPSKQKETSQEEIVKQATAYLKKNKPKLLFICFDDLDSALHNYGFGSKKYFETMTGIDGLIGTVYDVMESRGLLENALVLFVTDHGGKGKSHGGGSEKEKRVTFAANGPRLDTAGTIEDMELQDVAAVVLYALGIEQPEIMTGRVPKGIFPGVGGEERKQSDIPEKAAWYGSRNRETELVELELPEDLKDKLAYYQNFDGKVKGLTGGAELIPGLNGQGLDMRKGYLKTGIKNAAKWRGLTIGFWFRDDGEEGDPTFIADKNWKKGAYKGFAIAKTGDRLQVNVGAGDKYRKDILWTLPEGYKGKWVHCLVVFDQAERTASLYCDFEYAGKAELLPKSHSAWLTSREIAVGQDSTGKYPYQMNAGMDELMIFNQALTAEEIGELRDCYEAFFTE